MFHRGGLVTARNVKRGGQLMGVDMLFDAQVCQFLNLTIIVLNNSGDQVSNFLFIS